MNSHSNKLKILAGNASKRLGANIAKNLGTELGLLDASTFSDGEISIQIKESVRGADVFVVQSTCAPVNDHLMELLVIIDALKRASAGRINAVIPYFGYARQDRKAAPRNPITAKLVADLIAAAGAHRVLTMDLHSGQIQGFFNIPLDHLYGSGVLKKSIEKEEFIKSKDLIVVSPDVGSATRAREMATKFGCPLAIVDKRRSKPGESEVMHIVGDIEGKDCLLVDDMIDTAGTIVNGAEALKKGGARAVFAACTHAVMSGPAMDRLNKSVIEKVFCLDTIEIGSEKMKKSNGKIVQFSAAKIFADAITSIHGEQSISRLYD